MEIKFKANPEAIPEARQQLNEQKEQAKNRAMPISIRFKCKYSVPNASDIVTELKTKTTSNTYVQVSSGVSRDNYAIGEHDDVAQEITLFNVTDIKVGFDVVEREPSESEQRKVKAVIKQ